MVNTLKRAPDDFSSDVDRRARLHRRARLVVLAAVIGYFFLPYEVQAVIPVWLLFVAALGLEVEFFVGGWLQARQGVAPGPVDRGPQPRDLAELGPQYDEYEPLSLFPTDWYRAPEEAAPHRQWRTIAEAAQAWQSSRSSCSSPSARAAGTRSRRRTRRRRKPCSRARRA